MDEAAIALAEYCHHFSKVEKYLTAYYLVVMRLVGLAKEPAPVEATAYQLIGQLRPQVVDEVHHTRCDSVCYGPKIVTSGIRRRTMSTHPEQVHKPL